jgi:hypothetical protein
VGDAVAAVRSFGVGRETALSSAEAAAYALGYLRGGAIGVRNIGRQASALPLDPVEAILLKSEATGLYRDDRDEETFFAFLKRVSTLDYSVSSFSAKSTLVLLPLFKWESRLPPPPFISFPSFPK